MEYIQCSHCHKKYGINDKIRAAAGRQITCKHCQQAFEITIFETPSPSLPNEKKPVVESTNITATPQEKMPPHKPPKQRRKTTTDPTKTEPINTKKLSPSMLLGVAIIAVSMYVFYQDRNVEIGQPFVATESPKPTAKASNAVSHREEDSAKRETKTIVHSTLSEACKAISAQEWVIDYTMMHGMPDGNEYVHSIDESIQNTAAIREKCGSSKIVQEVLASAKEGMPPKWLEKHISALITLNKKSPHF